MASLPQAKCNHRGSQPVGHDGHPAQLCGTDSTGRLIAAALSGGLGPSEEADPERVRRRQRLSPEVRDPPAQCGRAGRSSSSHAGRPALYDEAAKQALAVLWEASDRVCGKRLKPLLRILSSRHSWCASLWHGQRGHTDIGRQAQKPGTVRVQRVAMSGYDRRAARPLARISRAGSFEWSRDRHRIRRARK